MFHCRTLQHAYIYILHTHLKQWTGSFTIAESGLLAELVGAVYLAKQTHSYFLLFNVQIA